MNILPFESPMDVRLDLKYLFNKKKIEIEILVSCEDV